MTKKLNDTQYLYISIAAHAAVLLALLLNYYFFSPIPVLENTNKNDVISAVILGDTSKSKMLPQKIPTPKPLPTPVKEVAKETPPPPVKQKPIVQAAKPDEIALNKAENKKKLAQQKAQEEKKRRDKLAKDLLADMEKTNKKQKKVATKKIQTQFDKILRQEAEKSLRQQLLNEEIKLQGTQSRQAQGEINKFKALIIHSRAPRRRRPPTRPSSTPTSPTPSR